MSSDTDTDSTGITTTIYELDWSPDIIAWDGSVTPETGLIDMLRSKSFSNSLFLYADTWDKRRYTTPGKRQATIRPWNCYGKHSAYPRSACIPMGESMYSTRWLGINEYPARVILDEALEEIRRLGKRFQYEYLVFISDGSMNELADLRINFGSPADQSIIDYVTARIYEMR